MNQESSLRPHPTTSAVSRLFEAHGGSRCGGESVSQLEPALQVAHFAEPEAAASPSSVEDAAIWGGRTGLFKK